MFKQVTHIWVLGSLLAALAVPALAENTPAPTPVPPSAPKVDVACIQAAVEKRDSVIIAATGALSDAEKAALSTRKDALKSAWAITDRKQRRDALRAAWSAFTKASRDARKAFRSLDHAAWKQFNTDRKACGATGAADDPGTEGHDAQL